MSGIECLIYLFCIVVLKSIIFRATAFATYSKSESELNIFTKVIVMVFALSIPATVILVIYAFFAARLDVFYVEGSFGIWLMVVGFIDTIVLVLCLPRSWHSKFLLFIGRSIK